MFSLPEKEPKVKSGLYQLNTDRAEVLALADYALEIYNRQWARFVATGSDEAHRLALAAWEDRAALLGEVGR